MVVTADFEEPARIYEIIFKKNAKTERRTGQWVFDKDLVKKLRLEYLQDGLWVSHGELETGM